MIHRNGTKKNRIPFQDLPEQMSVPFAGVGPRRVLVPVAGPQRSAETQLVSHCE